MRKIKKMTLNKALYTVLFTILTVVSIMACTTTSKQTTTRAVTQQVLQNTTQENLFPGIVRLESEGRGFCSGSVISDTEVLTAAHCISQATPTGFVLAENFTVRSIEVNGHYMVATSKVKSFNGRQDVAIVYGDFRRFSKLKLETNPDKDILANNYNLASCGFPYGGQLVCYTINNPEKMIDVISFTGQMYAGMSGGPVLDLKTNTIYAVNHAVTQGYVLAAPIVNLFDSLRAVEQ